MFCVVVVVFVFELVADRAVAVENGNSSDWTRVV